MLSNNMAVVTQLNTGTRWDRIGAFLLVGLVTTPEVLLSQMLTPSQQDKADNTLLRRKE